MTTTPDDARAANTPIRVVVAHEHAAVCDALSGLLDSASDIAVVGMAANADDALTMVGHTKADVAVAHLGLPRRSAIRLCRDIRAHHPHTRVLLLTAFEEDDALDEALRAGAAGYVLKGVRGLNLPGHVRRVASHDDPDTRVECSRHAVVDVEPA